MGSKEQVDALRNKGPVEISCTENIGKWLVTYKGDNTGTLDIKAQKFIGNRTYVFQTIVPNAVKRFATVDTEDYDVYSPMVTGTAQFVELDDHLDRTSKTFTTEYQERRFPKSSILSVYEFLKDEQFESALKSIKLEESEDA